MAEDVTPEHVVQLIHSHAMDPAIVVYPDGEIKVRSTVPTCVPALDDYKVIVIQEDLPDIVGDLVFDWENPPVEILEGIAEHLNAVRA